MKNIECTKYLYTIMMSPILLKHVTGKDKTKRLIEIIFQLLSLSF